jgi:hypothetical protein
MTISRFASTTVLGVALVVSACIGFPLRQATESATTGTPVPTNCLEKHVQSSRGPQTIDFLRENTTATVVGIFRGYGELRWNTPDGHRPSPEEFREKPATVVRSISIEVQEVVRGARESADHAIARGGTVGCDVMTYTDEPALVEGGRYMLFLLAVNDSDGQLSGEALVTNAWPIGNGDIVDTEADGEMPLAVAIDAVKNGTRVTAPPSPGEPPETSAGP